MSANQHDHITFGFQMTDIDLSVQRLESCKFIKMMAFITDFPPKFQHAYHMRIRILFQYLTSHCKSDTQKIIDYINSFSDAIEVDSILRNSNADKLRVYPALFELEQSGFLEVVEREELGAPIKVRKKKVELTTGNSGYLF